jgi:hypothetical protein
VVWYPPGRTWCKPLPWEPRGGTPLLCVVNDRARAVPFSGPRLMGVAGEWVVQVAGLVMDFGLFPASDPSALALVESSGCPSRYGARRLKARELGDLWDVPILLLDSLQDWEVTSLMEVLCLSPPLRLLHTGADVLLTTGFRGGLNGRESVVQELPGPRPWTDDELGLMPVARCQHRDLVLALQAAPLAEVRQAASADKVI